MPRFSLLHITDLHYADPKANFRDDDRLGLPPAFKSRYFDNLYHLLEPRHWSGSYRVDAIALTGDFTTHGQDSGFVAFETNLCAKRLTDLVPKEAICMVPGNHDVVWDLAPTTHDYFEAKFKRYQECVAKTGFKSCLIPKGGVPATPDDTIQFTDVVGDPIFYDPTKQIALLCINSSMRCGEVDTKIRAALSKPVTQAHSQIDLARAMIGPDSEASELLSHASTDLKNLEHPINKYSLFDVPHVTQAQISVLRSVLDTLIHNQQNWDRWIKVAALHHHLSPFSCQVPEHKAFELMADASDVLEFLASYGFHVILTGHKHQPYEQRVQSHGKDLVILGGMTVGGYPVPKFSPSIRHVEIEESDGVLRIFISDLLCDWGGNLVKPIADARDKTHRQPIVISTAANASKRIPFPEPIEIATQKQIYGRGFYKTEASFEIDVAPANRGHLLFTTKMSYTVRNLGSSEAEWRAEYNFDQSNGKIIVAKVNDDLYNPKDRNFVTGRGISIRRTVQPNEDLKVFIHAEERWPSRGSAFLTSYHPASYLRIKLHSESIRTDFDFEILYSYDKFPVTEGGDWQVYLGPGILPYQGVKLNWNTRRGRNEQLKQ